MDVESYLRKNVFNQYENQLIYSTRFQGGLEMNEYIKEAVLGKTAQLWKGYWSKYPASSILFIDIIYRYPDSFMSLRARADFNKFFRDYKKCSSQRKDSISY